MKCIKASYEIINKEGINGKKVLTDIEEIGRTCYKSNNLITEESAYTFVGNLIKNNHTAMIEHNIITVKFICDRGVSHELVRHRLASFAQESTRYCNYSKDKFDNEITFIKPYFWDDDSKLMKVWESAMKVSEDAYFKMLSNGATPQEARSVLPNSLKTEIFVSMNLREWVHFFTLRADKSAHPQMVELTVPLLLELHKLIPVIFDGVVKELGLE